ncbi:MAG: glycoside hydrolase family 140 protein, partial [Clostridiales bacterium]|nr:glycoside hydrolase family 140 protein [Clostridiales bacterium]
WDHVGYIIGEAEKRGIYIALLPTWGDKFNLGWGDGPELFRPDSAYRYGKWIASRYSGRPNLIWVMGGDRPLENRRHFEAICAMARGIREIDDGRHLMTFHPAGGQHSAAALHEEPWLDFNMIQSGHTRSRHNYEMIGKDYALAPPKPVIDGEPGYEDHPEGFDPKNGYLDAADARQSMYMALLSGACGHTYGNHSVWGFAKSLPVEGFQPAHFCSTWDKAVHSPGAAQMQHGKSLMLSRDFLSGVPRPELVAGQLGGALHVPVLKGSDYLMAYTSQGLPIRFAAGFLGGGAAKAWWYDPRTGAAQRIGDVDDRRNLEFAPPSGGRGNDWVFVADDASAGYGAPGSGAAGTA